MAQFNLSNAVDSKKVFFVKRSELEFRFDTGFYLPDVTEKIKKITTKEHFKLSTKIKSLNTGFNNTQNDNEGTKFFRTQNIRPIFLDHSNHSYTEDFRCRIPKKGSLLFTRIGVGVGDVAYNDLGGFAISDNVIAVEFDDEIFSKFISIYLNTETGSLFINREKRDTARALISYQNIKNILVPKTSKETQQNVIKIIDNAYTQKQQKEAKATALLGSIDIYLLKELGITLPEKDTSLQGRINPNVRLKDISGSRFDPMLYDKNTIALKEAIINVNENKFIVKPLKHFVIKSVAGDWGLDENDNIITNEFEKCLVIRATEFDNDYNLRLDNSRVKYRLIKKDKLEKIDIQENDLLIEKSGGSPDQPVGRISIITKDIIDNNTICYSNFIHKIRVESTKLNPQYLFCFLKTIHNIKLTEAMQSQTNGIRNLIMSTYLNQIIVLPIKSNGSFDLEKQTEIANHIQSIRAKAKQLQEEAKVVLEEAKIEVEKMILG